MTETLISLLLPQILQWLVDNLPNLAAAGIAAASGVGVKALRQHLSARNAKLAEEALLVLSQRLGEALTRGLAQATETASEQVKASEAADYVQRTMPQSVAKAGLTPDQLRARALAEARKARRH